MQFRILRTLASGPKDQSIAHVARRLGEYPDTISNALFRGDAEKFVEPNLLMSGLIKFHVSGTKKPHFKLNLSFIGFLWYLLEERPEKTGIETFNEVKRLYNNFGCPLLMEHNALEHLFFLQYYDSGNNEPSSSSLPQQADPISQKPGEYLLGYYKNELLGKFFRYDYFESYPPLDILLVGLYLMIPDDIIDTKTPHEIDQMIENYSPKLLQPLLRCLYQRKKIIRKGITDKSSSSSPSWLVSHHHITSAANMEQDEIAKIEFAMLFLTNSDLLYPLVNSKKYRSIAKKTAHNHDQQQPVMSIELMYELSGFVENVLSQHLSQWKERKKTLRRIKEMLLSSSVS